MSRNAPGVTLNHVYSSGRGHFHLLTRSHSPEMDAAIFEPKLRIEGEEFRYGSSFYCLRGDDGSWNCAPMDFLNYLAEIETGHE
jgi:hypothetical protein